jgi:hypothetical protein
MSFEERYRGLCVDLIKVNIINLSHDNQEQGVLVFRKLT